MRRLNNWPRRTDPCNAPFFTLVANAEILYFSHNLSFANSEFVFAIRDPKLARGCDEI